MINKYILFVSLGCFFGCANQADEPLSLSKADETGLENQVIHCVKRESGAGPNVPAGSYLHTYTIDLSKGQMSQETPANDEEIANRSVLDFGPNATIERGSVNISNQIIVIENTGEEPWSFEDFFPQGVFGPVSLRVQARRLEVDVPNNELRAYATTALLLQSKELVYKRDLGACEIRQAD